MWVLLNQLDQELKAAHTAVAAFRRVIYNSQIHSETNREAQQVSYFLSTVMLDMTFSGPHYQPNFMYFALRPISNPLTKKKQRDV